METLLIILLVVLVIAVPVASALLFRHAAKTSVKGKGKWGEKEVIWAIEHTKQGEYYLINGIILTDKNGMSHEIDHIVINKYGIFVIETKNYSGKIYGDEESKEWVQVLAGGRKKNKLLNPVKQNKSHIYCLKQILPDAILRPLVVFVQNNTQDIAAKDVIPLNALPFELTKYNGQTLGKKQMADCYGKIIEAKSGVTEKEHVQKIKKQQTALAEGKCPQCGGKLVVRNRKDGTGSFYGCSNYPKCKFTKNIE
ncbi:MAG: NERD domain-containing protein [Clostridia bacterium]|nr:NERD domain-containing protein [Clostridia bacterium]